jgi:hypothetical protein
MPCSLVKAVVLEEYVASLFNPEDGGDMLL